MKKIILFFAIILVSFCSNATDTTTVTLQVGAGSKFATINVTDKVTGGYVSATITNVSVQNSNPEFATVVLNPNSTTSIKATGVAAGSGVATVSCNVSYTDPGDGLLKNETKTIIISYTVIAAPHGVKLALVFN
jgi:hypothetical protein